MSEFLHAAFSPPVVIATTLLLIITFYWTMMIVGMVDLDLFDFDLDLDLDTNLDVGGGRASFTDLGVISLKALNLGDVPLMVWLTPFVFSFWVLAMLWDRDLQDLSMMTLFGTHTRNIAISILVAKIVTQPLKKLFATPEPIQARDLLGKDVTIVSLQADETFGQAEFPTGGAPLRLNVRTTGETFSRGELARVIDYDPLTHTYIIQNMNRET